jgi:hypothetical protein
MFLRTRAHVETEGASYRRLPDIKHSSLRFTDSKAIRHLNQFIPAEQKTLGALRGFLGGLSWLFHHPLGLRLHDLSVP